MFKSFEGIIHPFNLKKVFEFKTAPQNPASLTSKEVSPTRVETHRLNPVA